MAAKKNILFLQNSILPANGGVPRVSDIIAKELTKRGHLCYFIFYDKDNELYPHQFKLKVALNGKYEAFESSIMQFIADKQINVLLCQNTYFTPFIRVIKQVRKTLPSIAFFCFLHASPDYWQYSSKEKNAFTFRQFFMNSAKKIAKAIIFTFHNPYIKTTATLYELCDKFILLSESFKDSFLEIYGIEKANNKLLAIPNPLTFAEYLLPAEIKHKEKTVLIISRLEESQKKIAVALRIWKLLPKATRDPWKLLIVGTGPDEGSYKNYAKEHSLHNVHFTGHQTEVIGYYQRSSIFMMTSIWEGLPMSLLEAQQNGVVPIAFDNFSSIYDVIADGENGYAIKQNNIMDFRDKLCELMENEDQRNNMALKSIEKSKNYHVSQIADQWEQLWSPKDTGQKNLKVNQV